MPNELMHINGKVIKSLESILPNFNKKSNHATAVKNAWREAVYLDNISGGLYVREERLHTILRVGKKVDAHYLIACAVQDSGKLVVNGEVLVATAEVIRLINSRMIGANLTKRELLRYSEEVLIAIRECPEVKLKQEAIRMAEEQAIKGMKQKRIQQFKITKDELTNQPLDKNTAEFSHIRKKVEYRIHAYNVNNGLIVNKATHDVITKANIHDEEELLALCKKKNWNTTWYVPYVKIFVGRVL